MMLTKEVHVEVTSSGQSKEQAIGLALNQVQKKLVKDNSQIIIRIEPLSVGVIEAKEIIYTERFLFFFFPRERRKYEYKLDIKVSVSMLNVDEIQHETHVQKNNIPEFIKYKVKKVR
ncbi:DUF4312 family protein [Gottfriedia sp. NPDC056225]|uniref:DUF4312 family protein n=1 Tax=Gottfriedia sp. NPDC056225 TaxID=3345751 RepID=UPI001558E270|nr:DUF4312 family protein [Arthrobacter citreus]